MLVAPLSPRPSRATWLLLASLYCAQGLPSGLVAHALPALLRQQGVDLALIGLLKLLALPWLLTALWAPWVDRWRHPRLGHARGWILPLQGSVVLCLALLALLDGPRLLSEQFSLLLGLLLLINLAAATQDIATDGLTVRLLSERWRGLGNSVQVGGYKIGMLLSGSGLLLLVGQMGWNLALASLALLLAALTLPVWHWRERPNPAPEQAASGPALLCQHYRGLLRQPGMGAWLALLMSFKLGDSLASPMIKPMLVDLGWGLGALGQLTLLSSLCGILGALAGGWLYARLGAWRALLLGGVLQALTLASLASLTQGAADSLVYSLALLEQAADGLSSVVLFAAMMRQCRSAHEGADFTLQASLQLLLAGLVGATSGLLAKAIGYPGLFLTAGLLGLLALLLLYPARLRLSANTPARASVDAAPHHSTPVR